MSVQVGVVTANPTSLLIAPNYFHRSDQSSWVLGEQCDPGNTGWALCCRHSADSRGKRGSSHSCCGTHLGPSLLVPTACQSPCGFSGVPGCYYSRSKEVHNIDFTAVARPHHVKSRTFPHMQGNILSCWQNNVSDLEVQTPSWKERRFSWFKTVITPHKYILAWLGRLHKEIASLPTPTGPSFGKWHKKPGCGPYIHS